MRNRNRGYLPKLSKTMSAAVRRIVEDWADDLDPYSVAPPEKRELKRRLGIGASAAVALHRGDEWNEVDRRLCGADVGRDIHVRASTYRPAPLEVGCGWERPWGRWILVLANDPDGPYEMVGWISAEEAVQVGEHIAAGQTFMLANGRRSTPRIYDIWRVAQDDLLDPETLDAARDEPGVVFGLTPPEFYGHTKAVNRTDAQLEAKKAKDRRDDRRRRERDKAMRGSDMWEDQLGPLPRTAGRAGLACRGRKR